MTLAPCSQVLIDNKCILSDVEREQKWEAMALERKKMMGFTDEHLSLLPRTLRTLVLGVGRSYSVFDEVTLGGIT